VKSFEELDAWRKAQELVLAVYRATGKFPKDEQFGIVSQLRRAASSIPANIAEGFGRRSTKDLLRYLEIAGGSLEETRYFLRLSLDLHYLEETEFKSLRGSCDEAGRLLGGLGQALRKRLG
jgi:four helix bundle protein